MLIPGARIEGGRPQALCVREMETHFFIPLDQRTYGLLIERKGDSKYYFYYRCFTC